MRRKYSGKVDIFLLNWRPFYMVINGGDHFKYMLDWNEKYFDNKHTIMFLLCYNYSLDLSCVFANSFRGRFNAFDVNCSN